MKKTILLLAATFAFAFSHVAFAEKNHRNNHGHSVGSKYNHHKQAKRHGHHNRHHKHHNKHRKNSRHRHHSSRHFPLDYFVTGAIVGSLLNDHNHYRNQNHHDNRQHDNHQRHQHNTSSFTYWADQYGDCYRVDKNKGQERYTSVSFKYCK